MTSSDTAGQIRLAHDFDRAGKHSEALDLLRRAAEAGDAVAMTYLGSRLATGRAAPFQPEQGAHWLVRAGATGGPAAQRLASALIAAGAGTTADPVRALDGLLAAAAGGDASARGQIAAMTPDPELSARLSSVQPVSANTLHKARRAIDLKAWFRPATPEIVSEAPRVQVFRGFLSPATCDWIQGSASGRLTGTAVNGADGGGDRAMAIRTASGAGYALLDTDVVMALVRARIAAASGTPLRWFEPTNVLHYEAGQEYRPHYDFFNTDIAHFARIVDAQGQRSLTFLIYLNDDYDGGETAFPELDFAFKARSGDALLFFNVDEAGKPDPRTLHAGLPPTRGRKWLLSQWIRDRPQPIV